MGRKGRGISKETEGRRLLPRLSMRVVVWVLIATLSVATPPTSSGAPIIGGYGAFKFQYMPELLQPPAGANMINCHGLATDPEGRIYLTYQNDGATDKSCLIRWSPDGTAGKFVSPNNTALCSGAPHGLTLATEGGSSFLYHANRDQKLTKTDLNGNIIWQINGNFGQAPSLAYQPTWFAAPHGDYIYLCDGYGSRQVYSFTSGGQYTNRSFGGPGKGPGRFMNNHGCMADIRANRTIVVSDRSNHRLQFFRYDPHSPDLFEYIRSENLTAALNGTEVLPCNYRTYHEGHGVVADLSGNVVLLDRNDHLVSVVDVGTLLAAKQDRHPHDALLLPNGDLAVATWAPGRISYWKRL